MDKANYESCAQKAHDWQGNEAFPGHDAYQNGLILNDTSQTPTIYATKWYEGQPGSGYFTDQNTINSCMHNGVLNSNQLGEALQTAPSNYSTNGGAYQHKPVCTAYDVDFNRLNDLKTENPDLYKRLTNPDGLSPDNNSIKCAFGKAEANFQYGYGGGNQYYIDKDTFNDAVKAGVFKENPNKSFSESKGNLERKDITNIEKYENTLATKTNAVKEIEATKPQLSSAEINSQIVKDEASKPCIAHPDPAYHYGQTENAAKASASVKTDGISSENVAATTGGGTHAPPSQGDNSNLPDNNTVDKSGKASTQNDSFTPVKPEDLNGREARPKEPFPAFTEADLAMRNELKAKQGVDSAAQASDVNNGLKGTDNKKHNGSGLGA